MFRSSYHCLRWTCARQSNVKVNRRRLDRNFTAPTKATKEEESDEFFNILSILIPRGLLAFGIVHFTSEYVVLLTQCEGPSMLPTMESAGEVVLVDRWTPRRYGIQGGCTGEEQRLYNKRRQRKHSNPSEWYRSEERRVGKD